MPDVRDSYQGLVHVVRRCECGQEHPESDYHHNRVLEITPHGHCETCNGHHSDCGSA